MANTITQRIALLGGKELSEALKQIGENGEKAFDKLEHAANHVKIDKNVVSGLANIQKSLQSAGRSINEFGDKVLQIGRTASLVSGAVVALGAGFVALALKGGEAATAMGENAQKAGTTIEAFGRLSFAANQSGIDTETFVGALGRLSKKLNDAKSGNADAAATFRQLGIHINDSSGKLKSTEQILQEVATAFKKLPDGAEKSALAIELLGRSGAQLIPFFNEGGKAIAELGKEAERLGLIFSPQEFKIGDAVGDAVDKMKAALSALVDHIGLVFAPAVTAAADAISNFVANNKDAIIGFATGVRDAFAALPPGIQNTIGAIAGLVIAIGPALLALGAFIKTIGFLTSGLSFFLTPAGLIVLAIAAIVVAIAIAAVFIIKHWDEIKAAFKDGAERVAKFLQPYVDAWEKVKTVTGNAVAAVKEFVSDLFGLASKVGSDFAKPWVDAFNTISDTVSRWKDNIISWLDSVIEKAAAAARALFGIPGAPAAPTAPSAPGLAGGGFLRGPGTSTSDSIPMWGSTGEFMIRARAVKKYGLGLFAALNSMRINPNALRGFASGGFVSHANAGMKFAAGGLIQDRGPLSVRDNSPTSAVHLHIGGQQFSLLGPEEIVDGLMTALRQRNIASNGRVTRLA